jgi:hypothetical protein
MASNCSGAETKTDQTTNRRWAGHLKYINLRVGEMPLSDVNRHYLRAPSSKLLVNCVNGNPTRQHASVRDSLTITGKTREAS